ncbi:MAG: hypothetical protein WD407_00935 [Rhodospirillales bacterium]
MPLFTVSVYVGEKWDGNAPRQIEAQDEREAAERVCGIPLTETGLPQHLRATVTTLSAPNANVRFYDRLSQDDGQDNTSQ